MTRAANAPEAAAKPPRHGPLLRPTSPARAAAFLCVNLLAYAFANAFVHYVSSGHWVSTTAADYRASIGRPLGAMLLEPLNVLTHPWMILVAGLLLSVVIVVPLLVACLHHSRFCTLFLLCVMILAHAPVLALVLAAGCVLVAATPLRRRNPSLSLLLGLAPVAVYLYFSADQSPVALLPMQRLVLRLPFLVAALGAVVAGGMVLLIAHWTRYRPGVIWPVVAVLLAAPAWLFYRNVGADELAFAVLARRLAPPAGAFVDRPVPQAHRRPDRPPPQAEIAAVYQTLQRRKDRLVAACDRFAARYPSSSRLSAVLWIKGIALDTQISSRALDAGFVQHYDHFPLAASRATWTRLAEDFPADPRAAIACLRLARVQMRDGRLAEAQEMLEQAAGPVAGVYAVEPAGKSGSWRSEMFAADPGPPAREYMQDVAHEVEKLQWLLRVNHVLTDAASAEAFVAYVSLDPRRYRRHQFRAKVLDLAERFAETDLADNLHLLKAMDMADPFDRAQDLKALEDESKHDASIEANFQLGRLAMQVESTPGLGRLIERPEVYFKRVHDAVENPWQRLADMELADLGAGADQAP